MVLDLMVLLLLLAMMMMMTIMMMLRLMRLLWLWGSDVRGRLDGTHQSVDLRRELYVLAVRGRRLLLLPAN